jgi:hypothetical protein
MARALQSGPANMTDGFKFNRGSQQMKKEVERKKQGVITLNSVLTMEHKNVTQPNSTTLKKEVTP